MEGKWIRRGRTELNQTNQGPSLGLSEIRDTARLIEHHVQTTPSRVWRSMEVIDRLGGQTEDVLKLELFQTPGTFKVRGVFSVMLRMSKTDRRCGITTVSAGNHAVAVAYAARAFATTAKVVM